MAHQRMDHISIVVPDLEAVDDIEDTVARLRTHGAEVVEYENSYRLCYLRGPAGIIVALAEEIG